MSNSNTDNDLWNFVFKTSLVIEDNCKNEVQNLKHLELQLSSIEEIFSNADPVGDFHSYVLLHLCRSIRRSLQLKNS